MSGHRVEGGQLLATIRFGKRAAAVETMQDVADVVLMQVSVGYQVGEYEISIDGEEPQWRAPYSSRGGSVSALDMIRWDSSGSALTA